MSSVILISVTCLVVLVLVSASVAQGHATGKPAPAINHSPRRKPSPKPRVSNKPKCPTQYQKKPNPSCDCPPPRCQWKRVFKAVKGNGRDVYNDWISGLSMNENKAAARELESTLVFRDSSILDSWEQRDIERVKIEIYDEGVVMNWIVFNGMSSDINSWMTKERVIASPYSDIKDGPFQFFSTEGDNNPDLKRRFFIIRAYGVCDTDCGFMLVTSTTVGCPYENVQPVPAFYYSAKTECGYFASPGDRGSGDRFVISVLDCSIDV